MVKSQTKLQKIGDYSFFIITILVLTLISINYIFTLDNSNEIVADNPITSISPLENKEITSQNSNCIGLENIALMQKCKIDELDCKIGGDDCYFIKAQFYSNSDFCNNISNSETNSNCLLTLEHSKILTSSVLEDDINLCNNLKVQDEIDNCKDNYYFSKSYNTDNLTICSLIMDEGLKNRCEK